MRASSFALSLLVALPLGAAACSNKNDGSPAPVPATDAGPVVYQPQGCGYRVYSLDGFPAFEASADVSGPGAAPMHVRVGLGGAVVAGKPGYADPSTSFAVVWQTDAPTMASHVRYGASADKLDGSADGISYLIAQELSAGPADGTRFHEAHACGLQPGRTYYYQVGGGSSWSAVQSFTTAPAKGSKDALSFAFAGDSRDSLGRTDLPVWKAISAHVRGSGARMMLFSGDNVLVGADQSLWDKWTSASDAMAGSLFLAMAPGNHENELARYYAHAVMPGGPNNPERYASFDYGPVHFVEIDDYVGIISSSIDVNGYHDEVLAWLEADLAAADANRANVPWIVTFHHHPVYDSGDNASRVSERKSTHDAFAALYDKHHVDLDLAGHDHFYERSKTLAADAVAAKGTTYVVCAAGGAPSYGTTAGNPLSEKIVHYDDSVEGIYGVATASATSLAVKVYKLSGPTGSDPSGDAVVDTFTLTR